MGGDHAPDVVVRGSLQALEAYGDLYVHLVGRDPRVAQGALHGQRRAAPLGVRLGQVVRVGRLAVAEHTRQHLALDLTSARLGLALAVRTVLANALGLLGVAAPERM